MAAVKRLVACESGAAAIEYGLIAAFVGMGIILSLVNLRDSFGNFTNTAVNGLAGR